MQGSVDWQVREVFKAVNSIGESKHAAKEIARNAGAKTWSNMGKALGCHGYSSYDDYRNVARDAFGYIKAEFGTKDLTRVEPGQIHAFLVDKIESGGRGGDGVARATYNTYSAALAKLEVALNRYSEAKGLQRTYDFKLGEISRYAVAKLGKKNTDSRAYRDVKALTEAVRGKYNLLANIITESGTRISESNKVFDHQLRGLRPDPHTGEIKGWMQVKGKGGRLREVGMSPATYARLEKAIAAGGGKFSTNQGNYREELKSAAERTNQRYEGPHGQRWSFAQARHSELQKIGLSYEASLSIISQEMGHSRSDITCHYLH